MAAALPHFSRRRELQQISNQQRTDPAMQLLATTTDLVKSTATKLGGSRSERVGLGYFRGLAANLNGLVSLTASKLAGDAAPRRHWREEAWLEKRKNRWLRRRQIHGCLGNDRQPRSPSCLPLPLTFPFSFHRVPVPVEDGSALAASEAPAFSMQQHDERIDRHQQSNATTSDLRFILPSCFVDDGLRAGPAATTYIAPILRRRGTQRERQSAAPARATRNDKSPPVATFSPILLEEAELAGMAGGLSPSVRR
nr:hypothetical protein Iba_chr12dCG10300 [Ipomoea batatas]